MNIDAARPETTHHPVPLHGYVPGHVIVPPGERLLIDMRQTWAAAPQTPVEVEMHDARRLQAESGCSPADFFAQFSFVLLQHRTAMLEPEWADPGAVASVYAAEVKTLIDEQLRLDGVEVSTAGSVAIRRGPGADNYGAGVHQDYGLTPDDYEANVAAFVAGTPYAAAGRQWRQKFAADGVRGFSMINFWRPVLPMRGPIEAMPLAVCDPRTVSSQDVVPSGLLGFTSTGEPTVDLRLKHSPAQRWCYYPRMTRDEVLVFKNFEYVKERGRGPVDRPQLLPHSLC